MRLGWKVFTIRSFPHTTNNLEAGLAAFTAEKRKKFKARTTAEGVKQLHAQDFDAMESEIESNDNEDDDDEDDESVLFYGRRCR
jgi:hypothetical protein